MVYILPFGREVAIGESRILSARQITAHLHAIYSVLCWFFLYQVNAKYSPQIQFSNLCLKRNARMYRKCADVRMLKIFKDRLALAS